MNNRMDRDEFFEFVNEYREQHPHLEYFLMLQQSLSDALNDGDIELFNLIQEQIDEYFEGDL